MNTAAAQGMRTVTALTRSAAVRPEVGSEDRSEHAVELCHVTARPTSVEDAPKWAGGIMWDVWHGGT